MGDRDGGGAAPPADVLNGLPRPTWQVVLRHARAALQELDGDLVTPRMEQLRATPDSRLMDGRSRRDLCHILAAGGPVWERTAEGIAAQPHVDLGWLLRGETPPERPDAGREPPDPSEDAQAELIARLKERSRGYLEERDEARRRAEGLEARLRTEQERLGELESDLEALRAQRDDLGRQLEDAAEQRRQELDRARRRHDSEVAELQEELRRYRRREQQREERRRRQRERREDAEERAREEIARFRDRSGPRLAEPGRPTRLPPGVAPGTVDEVRALLGPGRRVLVDGYNVTKQHLDHLELEEQRRRLIRRLEALASRTGVRCTVVFDGDPSMRSPGVRSREVRTVFTAGGEADDEIVDEVDGLPSDEPVLVVTDDRELVDRVRGRAADVVGTRPFLEVAR